MRAITGRIPTILDRFEMGVRIAKHYLESDPRIRLAVVGHEPMIHPERFGELVARNRGADARVFTDEAQALDWLLRAPGRPLILHCVNARFAAGRPPDTLDSNGLCGGPG